MSPVSFSEIFEEHLPLYMAMGMTPEQYWDGDCALVIAYRKANELKKQQDNARLWMQGAYIRDAIVSALSDPKKPVEYPAEPYPLTKKEKAEQEARAAKRKLENMEKTFAAWAAGFNAQKAGDEHGRDS